MADIRYCYLCYLRSLLKKIYTKPTSHLDEHSCHPPTQTHTHSQTIVSVFDNHRLALPFASPLTTNQPRLLQTPHFLPPYTPLPHRFQVISSFSHHFIICMSGGEGVERECDTGKRVVCLYCSSGCWRRGKDELPHIRPILNTTLHTMTVASA